MSESLTGFEVLLMKVVDGVADEEEQALLMAHIKECDTRRAELQDFLAVKATTDAMRERILLNAALEPLRGGRRSRFSEYLGVLMLLGGSLVLAGYSAYAVLEDPAIPGPVKYGLGTVIGGSLLLLLRFGGRRLWSARRDPYREIER